MMQSIVDKELCFNLIVSLLYSAFRPIFRLGSTLHRKVYHNTGFIGESISNLMPYVCKILE
jgi:hypothetical protein